MLPSRIEISGFLCPYLQYGTDRILWSISEKSNLDPEGVISLQEDDHLIVFNRDGSVRWEGQIHLEYSRMDSPMQEYWTRQMIFGYVVHGFQSDCSPEAWATMFFAELPATLRRLTSS
jgi:hypothetical protein